MVLVPLVENCISKCLERLSGMKPSLQGVWPFGLKSLLGPSAQANSPARFRQEAISESFPRNTASLCSRLAVSGHTPLVFHFCAQILGSFHLKLASVLLQGYSFQGMNSILLKRRVAGIGTSCNQDNSSHLSLPKYPLKTVPIKGKTHVFSTST